MGLDASVNLQCGDDMDRATLAFYGQSTYAQGAQAVGLLYASLLSAEKPGVTMASSGNLVPADLKLQAYSLATAPFGITYVTHATDDSDFWTKWKEGATAAVQDFKMTWYSNGFNASLHVAAIEEACASATALVVTIPYSETEDEYTLIDDAIKACQTDNPTLPIVTTNTDSYHNPEARSPASPATSPREQRRDVHRRGAVAPPLISTGLPDLARSSPLVGAQLCRSKQLCARHYVRDGAILEEHRRVPRHRAIRHSGGEHGPVLARAPAVHF